MLKSNLTPAMQGAVASEVNSRLQAAVNQLQDRYESGNASTDTSVDGPTGSAYKEAEKRANEIKKEKKAAVEAAAAVNEEQQSKGYLDSIAADNDMDEDRELRSLREKRLQKLKAMEMEKLANLGLALNPLYNY
jgi:hypothetical protein